MGKLGDLIVKDLNYNIKDYEKGLKEAEKA